MSCLFLEYTIFIVMIDEAMNAIVG